MSAIMQHTTTVYYYCYYYYATAFYKILIIWLICFGFEMHSFGILQQMLNERSQQRIRKCLLPTSETKASAA